MKLGILITTYNRPEYLKRCLESVKRAEIPEGTQICISDDCSDNQETKKLIVQFFETNETCSINWQQERKGIKQSILAGVWHLINKGCDTFINLDGDALVRNDFVSVLLKLHNQFPDNLITGFNCNTLNADGSIRHKILEQGEGWNKKNTVGGINLFFTREMFDKWLLPALREPVGNWDQKACLNAGNGVICAVPSVVQHIGFESSMGHSGSGRELPDTADDFKLLHLPNVTLIGIDTQPERLKLAFEASQKDIIFGDVKMITDVAIKSKEEYSRYCIKELHKQVQTDFMLVIQWDGYVLNANAWNPEWLKYDWIGAPWEWYTDGMQVGNGGFSLRSTKLMRIVSEEPCFNVNYHPEDDVICRKYRLMLESRYGIKFAPVEEARKFSIEGYRHWNQTPTTEFGFHGIRAMERIGRTSKEGDGKIAYIEQYFGIGDVIFCAEIARYFQKKCYKVVWPVLPEYVEGLNRAYPDITFMECNLTDPKLMNNNQMVLKGNTLLVPLRWTYEILKVPFNQCMRSKYDFLGLNWEDWKKSTYERNEARESQLMKDMGIVEGEPYTLVNDIFQSNFRGKAQIPPVSGKVVKMSVQFGYSLFDWSKIIENATEIHTVSTSIIYLFELLELKAEKIYIYLRKPQETNHDNYRYIMTRHTDKYVFV